MKWMSLVIAAALAVGLVGCGTSNTATTDDGKLTVTNPGDVTIKPGDSKPISVSIKRPNTDEEVTVKFKDLPSGVTADPSEQKVKKGGTKAEFTLKADKDAKEVENATVKVEAKYKETIVPEEFKISIKK